MDEQLEYTSTDDRYKYTTHKIKYYSPGTMSSVNDDTMGKVCGREYF